MHEDLRTTRDAVEAIAAEHGWSARLSGASESTISLYVELFRACRADDDTAESIADYGLTGGETVVVRISDHGNAHRGYDEMLGIRIDGNTAADLARLRDRLTIPAKK